MIFFFFFWPVKTLPTFYFLDDANVLTQFEEWRSCASQPFCSCAWFWWRWQLLHEEPCKCLLSCTYRTSNALSGNMDLPGPVTETVRNSATVPEPVKAFSDVTTVLCCKSLQYCCEQIGTNRIRGNIVANSSQVYWQHVVTVSTRNCCNVWESFNRVQLGYIDGNGVQLGYVVENGCLLSLELCQLNCSASYFQPQKLFPLPFCTTLPHTCAFTAHLCENCLLFVFIPFHQGME